jgi:dipeptidyl aminopeptidase/acylaminoacyl peptidase
MNETTKSFEPFLNVRSANGGQFAPDGRALVYLMNTSGTPQVFRQDAPAQAAKQLTSSSALARSVYWSPNGKQLAVTLDNDGNEREQILVMDADGSNQRALTHNPESIHAFGGWSPDAEHIAFASNARNAAHFDIYIAEVGSGETRQVLQRDAHLTAVGWSPDGCMLLIQERHTSFDQDLHLLDLATGELRHLTPHSGSARYLSARCLPDNRSLLLCTDQDRDFLALAKLDTKMRRLRPLLERRADVEACDASADGRRIVALLNRDGWAEVVVARLDERLLRGLVSVRLPGVVECCQMNAAGNRVALSLNGPTFNFNVWGMDPETTARTQWTKAPFGDLEGEPLVEPTAVQYTSHDGLAIPALLYRPRTAGSAPTPTVVHVHGGPEAQDRPNFSPVYQYLVHRGYSVLAPNVRGSTGYGNRYCHLDDREKRYDALRDVEYAHRWLVSSGMADPARIGIMGGSYGGFTVLACLTRQPEIWAAGVDIVGISNFETFFENTGPWRRHLRASEYGDPVEDRELLRDLSPIHAIDRIQAPLMVIQGATDPRVPQEESDQLVEQLRARNHPVEYLLFPDEGHGIVKIPNRIQAYTAIGAFLDRHLMPPHEDEL